MEVYRFSVRFSQYRKRDDMRIAKQFGERKTVLSSSEPKRKYIFAYEGSLTERLYFEGVSFNKENLGISALLDMNPLVRSISESGWSHPKKLLECLIDYLRQAKDAEYKVSNIIDLAVEYLYEHHKDHFCEFSKQSLYSFFISWLKNKCNLSPNDMVKSLSSIIKELNICVKQKLSISDFINSFENYICDQQMTYDSEIDRVCIIIDRDRQSFSEQQYDSVVQTCNENKFKLYITNPCFEFWLLMHFNEVHQLYTEKLLKNPKVTSKRRYTEDELRKLVRGYKKNNIQFNAFSDKIDTAIKNEKSFTEDISGLKNRIGSNIGILLLELREK